MKKIIKNKKIQWRIFYAVWVLLLTLMTLVLFTAPPEVKSYEYYGKLFVIAIAWVFIILVIFGEKTIAQIKITKPSVDKIVILSLLLIIFFILFITFLSALVHLNLFTAFLLGLFCLGLFNAMKDFANSDKKKK